MDGREALARVRAAVLRVVWRNGVESDDIQPESSLIYDLSFDSLRFVDLTVALEDELFCAIFPMQDWIDLQLNGAVGAFTVESLVNFSQLLIDDDQPRAPLL